MRFALFGRLLLSIGLISALTACNGVRMITGSDVPESEIIESQREIATIRDTGRGGLIGVNPYLWRASLDTLSFMPMDSIDSTAGTILTEWYVNPDVPTERLKVNVYVLDSALRAGSLRVSVFREVARSTQWTAAPVRAGTAEKLEDAILARAREIRIAVLEDS